MKLYDFKKRGRSPDLNFIFWRDEKNAFYGANSVFDEHMNDISLLFHIYEQKNKYINVKKMKFNIYSNINHLSEYMFYFVKRKINKHDTYAQWLLICIDGRKVYEASYDKIIGYDECKIQKFKTYYDKVMARELKAVDIFFLYDL